jgi:hypothetical protein
MTRCRESPEVLRLMGNVSSSTHLETLERELIYNIYIE